MEERQTIELVAVLGTPEPDDELEVLRTMLCYQLLWRGGLEPRIALDAKLGALLSLCEFDLNIISRPEFANHMINFWVQSANLAEMVAEGIALSLPPATAEIMHLHA